MHERPKKKSYIFSWTVTMGNFFGIAMISFVQTRGGPEVDQGGCAMPSSVPKGTPTYNTSFSLNSDLLHLCGPSAPLAFVFSNQAPRLSMLLWISNKWFPFCGCDPEGIGIYEVSKVAFSKKFVLESDTLEHDLCLLCQFTKFRKNRVKCHGYTKTISLIWNTSMSNLLLQWYVPFHLLTAQCNRPLEVVQCYGPGQHRQ